MNSLPTLSRTNAVLPPSFPSPTKGEGIGNEKSLVNAKVAKREGIDVRFSLFLPPPLRGRIKEGGPVKRAKRVLWPVIGFFVFIVIGSPYEGNAAEKLTGLYSARVMSQSMPWIAQEAGLFQKYNLDFQLVFIASSGMATAALLGGDVEVTLTGGVGIVRAFIQGNTDVVFIGSVKNVMTQSIVGGGNIKRPEDLKGKRIGVSRIGGNTHYFTIQALRRYGLDPGRDFTFIQTGGDPEAFAALVSNNIDAATVTAPTDAQALAHGFRYIVYGPDLRIPYAATAFVTRRTVMAKRPQAIAQFMRVMAEASKILHTDKELIYKVMAKQLRITDKSVMDAAYNAEIKALEPRLVIKSEALQAILEEVSKTDARANRIKPQELVDTRYLDEMEKSGFFDKIWGGKR
ncbi:MAG: NrtA/SsuA/CpmA family ABC transporter substrate-binding protein [Deltaproteobacteria bacterium]|nr:NrtA/SsuA/CpmA family ABC transporter substrate-binding protein [Deltaproteobacteria bacterium]